MPRVMVTGVGRVEAGPILEVHVVGVAGIQEGQRGVFVDELVAAAVDGAHGLYHRGLVAADEAGVRHATQDGDLGVGALHQVAAAVEVADAEVAAVAGEVGVRRVQLVGELGVVDGGVGVRPLGDGAAVVVAAEEGHDAAAVHVDGDGRRGRAGAVDADEGVLGAAEDGVQMQQVVVLGGQGRGAGRGFGHADDHVGRLDVGHRAGAALALLAVLEVGAAEGGVAEAAGDDVGIVLGRAVFTEVPLPGVDRARVVAVAEAVVGRSHRAGEGGGAGPGAGAGVVGRAVAVVAAAAAVDVGDARVAQGLQGAHLDGGGALHPARYVVAAVDGIDGVGVVHRDGRVAAADHRGGGRRVGRAVVDAHVGHAAAAAHVAQHHGCIPRVAVVGLVQPAVQGDGIGNGVVDVVGGAAVEEAVLHHGRQGGRGAGGHRVALHQDIRALVGGGVGARAPFGGAFQLGLQEAAGRGVDAVDGLHEGQLVVDRRGRRQYARAVFVVDGIGGGDAGRAEGFGVALAVVEVDAHALDGLHIFGVGRGDGQGQLARSVAHDVHHGLQLLGVAQRGLGAAAAHLGQVDALQTVGRVGRRLVDVDAVGDLLHRQEQGAVAVGFALRAVHIAVVVALGGVGGGGVGLVVSELDGLGALIAVARHLPAGYRVAVAQAHRVVVQPVVGLRALAVVVGHVGDGGAEVPVEPDARLLVRGAHLDGVHLQCVLGADDVGAVVIAVDGVVPLLVVVARGAGAAPDAEGGHLLAGRLGTHRAVLRVGHVGHQHQVDVALLGDVGDGVHRVARDVDGRGVALGVEHHGVEGHRYLAADGIRLVRVALRAVEPPQAAVGQGVLLLRSGLGGHLLGRKPQHGRQQQ